MTIVPYYNQSSMANLSDGGSPYIIGITGRIGSGKSLVRQMLEHLGCLTVDADRLAHQVYRLGSPAHGEVVASFGPGILNRKGEIDRKTLGKMVFSDPVAMRILESITHPMVTAALQRLARLSPLPIIAVEAIKLFESGYYRSCDSVWLVEAPQAQVFVRLNKTRGLSPAEIRARMDTQTGWREKKARASATIRNHANIQDVWAQVSACWDDLRVRFERFLALANLGSNLLVPFTDGYQLPDLRTAQKLARIRDNKEIGPILPVLANDLVHLYNPQDTHELAELWFHILCTRHVWVIPLPGNQSALLGLNIANYKGQVILAENPGQMVSPRKLQDALTSLAGFSRLHLLHNLEIHAGGHRARWDESGYGLIGQEKSLCCGGKAEYNVYNKQIMPPLQLFEEQEM